MRVYLNTDVIILMMYHQGLNFSRLADKAGYTREHIGKTVKSGTCTKDMAAKIAGALGLPDEAILLPIGSPNSFREHERVSLNYEVVRRLMKEQNLSVKDTAKRIGRSYQWVYNILQQRAPRRGNVEKLAAALGVEADEIIKEAVQGE